jgi:hypothetical protein
MRFTIRDVLWGTVVIAMFFGWWIDHAGKMELQYKADEMEEILTADGWSVKLGRWSVEMERTGPPGKVTSHKTKHVNSEWILPVP